MAHTDSHPKAVSAAPIPGPDTVDITDIEMPAVGPPIPIERLVLLTVPGILALAIVGSICVRYVIYGAEEVPQLLAYALTSIIGFYFGAGVSSSATGRRATRERRSREASRGRQDHLDGGSN